MSADCFSSFDQSFDQMESFFILQKGMILDCEQSLFCSKIRRENERDSMRDIRAVSGEAASRE